MTGMRLVGTSAAEAVIKPLAFWPEAQSCPASSGAELVWHSRSLYITRPDFHFWSTVSEELQKLQIGFVVTYVQGRERTSVTSCLAPCWVTSMSGSESWSCSWLPGFRFHSHFLCVFCWDSRGLHWHVRHFLTALYNRSRISEAFGTLPCWQPTITVAASQAEMF